jgi:transcription elongation factor Elf1
MKTPTVNLGFRCPACNAKIKSVASMNYATQVVQRTCPKCRAKWQLKVTPTVKTHVRYDVGEFVQIS